MTALTDHFEVTHKKDIKNGQGQVVRQVDYIGWSQAADRLDEADDVASWSFAIMGLGEDWCHGRLSITDHEGNTRHYENIGYAENASADWKKEALKDAASDALKRCAALAGVARYLYDKDDGRPSAPPQTPSRTPQAPARPHIVDTSVPEEPDGMFEPIVPFDSTVDDKTTCPIHGVAWGGSPGDLFHKDGDKWCRHPDNVKRARAR